MTMRVAFYTLGCKLNQAEAEALAGRFGEAGFRIVSPVDGADIYVANTCTVTHVADRKARRWLRMARRNNPHAVIIATGCYVERSRHELVGLADLLIGNGEKEHLPEIVGRLPRQVPRSAAPCPSAVGTTTAVSERPIFPLGGARLHPGDEGSPARTRSLVKIQDGCRGSCTYCIVPAVRPGERSLPADRIIEEVKQKVAAGYREVVLTGTKAGSYHDCGNDIAELVRQILRETTIERLRLSSLQPPEVSPSLLALWHDRRLCRHFHLPLQSGSGAVLRRMNRRYSPERYRQTLQLIRDMIPQAAITTDIMVGFPAETADEFEQSYSFCREAGFADIHVFPFSPRPGTAAARMRGGVVDGIKDERNQRMLDVARESRHRFSESVLGQIMAVLWEKEACPDGGTYSGLTDNYLRVFAASERRLTNEITPVRLVERRDRGIWGEVVAGRETG